MEIFRGVEIVGRALYVESLNSLVIGDVHIGYEEALNKRGVLIPRHHFKDVMTEMREVFQQLPRLLRCRKLESIVINGDLKHEFGGISEQEWREILKFFDLLSSYCGSLVLIKGNHDPAVGPVARKMGVRLVDGYSKEGVFICHGHEIPKSRDYENSKLVIIGNEHPAVTIKDGVRAEKFKCFLKGAFEGKAMVVMPSLNPVTVGTDVLKEKFISPFMKTDISDFEVFVVADESYYFGKVRDLKGG